MSAIPETRTIDKYRRVNVPANIAASFGDGATFEAGVQNGSVVLTPTTPDDGRTLTDKNRIRLPAEIVEKYGTGAEFAVFQDGNSVVLKPTSEIDISV